MANPYDLVEIVADDLRYIRQDWDDRIDDHSLRRGSATLRRLLVDGELRRAWRMVGLDEEPRVDAPSLNEVLSTVPRSQIMLAAAGGAIVKGVQVQEMLLRRHDKGPEHPTQQSSPPHDPPVERLGLRKFGEMPCIIIEGDSISRRTLVKYVANKLGGAHFDPGRERAKREEGLFSTLDEIASRMNVLGKDIVYFELLSIGQALTRSSDIARFFRAAESRRTS